jgi:DNA oxidative demethylase
MKYLPQFLDRAAQEQLVEALRLAVESAPLFTPVMPKTGKPFSVRMTNLGTLGWVSDKQGYRYQPTHPDTGVAWPAMPASILDVWAKVSDYPHPPEACLVNYYIEGAKMGLHQDRDEDDFAAPVVSISLKLSSGDVLVMGGESRLAFHGIDRVMTGTSTLLKSGGRINLTMRRVTKN